MALANLFTMSAKNISFTKINYWTKFRENALFERSVHCPLMCANAQCSNAKTCEIAEICMRTRSGSIFFWWILFYLFTMSVKNISFTKINYWTKLRENALFERSVHCPLMCANGAPTRIYVAIITRNLRLFT